MARLIAALVRHGAYRQPADTPGAHLPHPLTEGGRAQARRGAATLAEDARRFGCRLWPVLDCSVTLRAYETAEVVRGELAALEAVEPFEALAERSVGAAANLTLTEIDAVLRADPRWGRPLPEGWKADSRFRLPVQGAESLLEAGARVARHLRERMEALRGQAATDTVKVFVGHGGSFRHAAVQVGVLDLAEAPRLSMYHGRPVYLELAADGTWRHVGGEWKVRRTEPVVPE